MPGHWALLLGSAKKAASGDPPLCTLLVVVSCSRHVAVIASTCEAAFEFKVLVLDRGLAEP